MNKQDIDKAVASLDQASRFFSPMITAFNQADEVFSVLSNAIVLKESLEREVDALKAMLEPLKAEVESSKEAITANNAAVIEAKAQAEKDIADAKAQATESIKAIQANAAERVRKATANSEAKIAEVTAASEDATAKHEDHVSSLQSVKDALQTDVTALESKLATLREQAKKFAASLVE